MKVYFNGLNILHNYSKLFNFVFILTFEDKINIKKAFQHITNFTQLSFLVLATKIELFCDILVFKK